MEFLVLGPLEVRHEERSLTIGGPKQQAVLAILLAHPNRVVSADQLIDEVWGEAPPGSARRTLHSFVSNLRRLINTDHEKLQGRASGYTIDVDPADLDALRFAEATSAGLAALDGDPTDAVHQLTDALALWRGTPFGQLADETPSLGYEAVRLNELRMTAVEGLIEARLRSGEHQLVVPELRELVREYPFRERLLGQLMVALHRSGRTAEALRAYRDGSAVFAEELGTEPGPDLRELELQILTHDPRLDPTVPDESSWPRYHTKLVGRRDEIETVVAALGRERLVTLIGPPGIGKTRLAADIADRLAGSVRLFWIDLDGAPAVPGSVARRTAGALAVRDSFGTSPQGLVAARLAESESILVLDNVEHVLAEAADMTASLLAAVESTRVLTASRQPLGIGGEFVYRVPPMPVPPATETDPDTLRTYESIALLDACARSATGEPLRLDTNANAAARVVRELDGLPLGIELAAGKLRSMSVPELEGALHDRLGLLVDGDPTATPRHRTLETAIDSSYESLSAEDRQVLHGLAAFPSSFNSEAAREVAASNDVPAAAVTSIMTRLVDRSLLMASVAATTRYRLLESIRRYVLART